MQLRFFVVVFTFLAITIPCFGAGESEASSSSRSEYLASKGIIIPPKDILPESFIAQIDYEYPDPHPLPVGLTVRTGNRQIGSNSKKELIHIGLKAYKISFELLPPLNLVYVIDISGSMYDANKIAWVKEALEIFLSRVRKQDYVALVVFNENAQVVFQSTKMDQEQKKTKFKNAVKALSTSGGSNILSGMTLGYKQAQVNFNAGYSNRVVFMTDGLAERKGIMEMAESYKKKGINCSTVGMGVSFNSALMVELAQAGGGSSRFISNHNEMRKIFSDELDRMLVSAARDVTIDLRLLNGATLLNTWGYENQQKSNLVRYSLSTLHNGDYETILAEIGLPEKKSPGDFTFAEVHVSYNIGGQVKSLTPVPVISRVVNVPTPVYSVSDPTVLRSSTMLHIARSLSRIGTLYYSTESIEKDESTTKDTPVNPAMEEALLITIETRKRVQNTRQVLNDVGFDDEIKILEQYIEILGTANKLEAPQILKKKEEREITPPVKNRSLEDHISYLINEVVLSLPLKNETSIAFAGFSYNNDRSAPILDEMNKFSRRRNLHFRI